MKKIISVFILVLLFIFTLSTGVKVNAKENKQLDKDEVISTDITYDTWEEAREYEYIFYNQDNYKGLLKVKCAYRIGDTQKIKVTYVNKY